MLGAPQVRRLLLAILAEFQEEQIRRGKLSRHAAIGAVASGKSEDGLDRIVLDEAELGLDSLSVIDLATRLNIFFGLDATGVEDFLLVRRSVGDWVDLIGWHLAQVGPMARLTFETSGSTGRRKRLTHCRTALESEIDALRSGPLRNFRRAGRVLSMVPAHHIYGFIWGVLLPARAGWTTRDMPLGAVGPAIRAAQPGDLVLGTPFIWDRAGTLGACFPPGVTGVCSGGPSTGGTWRSGQAANLSRMIEVYGSSETGGIGWREDGGSPFRLMQDLTQGPAGIEGRGRPMLELQDRLAWTSPAEFTVVGRFDTVVQVAGTNVNLADVKAQLEAQGGVREAAVRLCGERLKAFIVLEAGHDLSAERRLREAMLCLPAPARPDRYTFGAVLPTGPTGKLSEW